LSDKISHMNTVKLENFIPKKVIVGDVQLVKSDKRRDLKYDYGGSIEPLFNEVPISSIKSDQLPDGRTSVEIICPTLSNIFLQLYEQ
jgi:hypothetical protein